MLSIKSVATTRRTGPYLVQWHFHFLHLTSWSSLVLMLLGLLLLQAPEHVQTHPLIPTGQTIEFRRYCSDRLSDAIRLICGGRTNSLGRKFPDSVGGGGSLSALKSFAPTDGTFHNPIYIGAIHECCRRPCGYSDLKMYCADD